MQPQHGFKALDRTARRVERAEAAYARHGSLHSEVVALDALLQVLGDLVERRARQKAITPRSHDGRRIGPSAIRTDAVRCEKRLIRQHLAEEALGCVKIPVGGQQKVDRVPVLVDGPVQVAPLAADLDVGLIDLDRAAVRLAKRAQPFLDQWRIGQDPTVQGAVIDLQATLKEEFLDIAVAQRIAQVPGDGLDDECRLVVPAFKVALGAPSASQRWQTGS